MAPLQPLADRFGFNEGFLDRLIEGFTRADWLARHGDSNHAQWLLGHLAASRGWALRLLGSPLPREDWEPLFAMGARPTAQSDAVAPERLREAFRSRGVELRDRLSAITPEQTAAEFTELPGGTRDVAGGLHFVHFHESYHLGQIGLLRRMAGRPGPV